ncbi:MAG: V-type ATP synthase subunit D [Clostridiales bacterium]|nr:V-type ATP synthase subunit D [Clostridiales bacterium]
MALLRVNPTRMELTRLKKRLRVARRGHKLLKDKRDELMKKFLEMIRKNSDLRQRTELLLIKARAEFVSAKAAMDREMLDEALMMPGQEARIDVSVKNIMSVNVPVFNIRIVGNDNNGIYPYGFALTSGDLDKAVEVYNEALPLMLSLAEMEKAAQLLAAEIEKTRRRVNALEYIMIPQLVETIRYITMKLDENERGNLTRLMKVKDMMLEQARAAYEIENNKI